MAEDPELEAMRRYRIGGEILAENARELQAALASVYGSKERPLCLCRDPGIAMYIARMGE